MDEEILEGLNPQQRQAVTTTEGPLLVLAGAGSGKTSVLTRRIAWILEKGLAARHQILAVTFTNKAAREMAERIEGLCGDGHFRNMGTFHSVCSRWLRREADYLGIPSNFSIYDTSAQLSVMKACLKELAISEKEYTPRTLLSHVSRCKNYSTPLSELQRGNKFEQAVALVYPRYNKKLLDNSALDFDDILVYAVKLFKENPEVLEKYSDMIRYVLVDEYQDVNPVQYELLRLISGKRRNFCAVGDDDQSIYGFRGADVSIILRFRDDFPDAGIIKLEQNYRSTQSILDAANALVSHNYGRMDKAMWCSSGDGTKPKVYQAMNGEEEALFVASEIRKLEKSGCKRSDIAVLYRTNAQSRVFEEVFMKRGIAHDLVGGMKFYERKEIKDLLAFLNIIANNNDTISLGRILELLPGVGEKTRDKIVQYAVTHRIAFYMALQFGDEAGLRPAQAKAVKDIFGNLERLHEKAYAGVPVRVLLDDILTFTDYKYSILKNDDPETESRRENIDELVAVVSEFDAGNEDDGVPLELFLQSVSLMSDQDTMLEDPDKVSMMTLHTSKGLEFPVVFLAGLEEDSLPHYRAAQDGSVTEIDEERRLCYVGMTRAKKLLYLSFATLRNQFGQIFSRRRSRFLDEIPEEMLMPIKRGDFYQQDAFYSSPKPRKSSLTSARSSYGVALRREAASEPKSSPLRRKPSSRFSAGDRVAHRVFKAGNVVSVSGDTVTVIFDSGEERKIKDSFLAPDKSPKPVRQEVDGVKVADFFEHSRYGRGVVVEIKGDMAWVKFQTGKRMMTLEEIKQLLEGK